MIRQYEKRRIGQVSAFTLSNELTVHMLRLARGDLKMTQRHAHLSPAHLRGAGERLLEGLTGTPLLAHELAPRC
jgi:hypothetical protein